MALTKSRVQISTEAQMSATTYKLFTPIKVGNMSLEHRVVMAPMTRLRTTATGSPLNVVKEYYSQRASTPGTLIITEGTVIGIDGAGLRGAPGIWSEEQITAWKEIANAVHAKKCYIYLQIVAMGRVAKSAVLKAMNATSHDVVSPGDIPIPGGEVPRPMTLEEIKTSLALFAEAAVNAVHKAGFDGVEIHGANGYLVDQFIQDVSNNRTDEYGGSIKNRARYPLEVVDAITKAVGEERTSIRFSPWAKDTVKAMGMKNPIPTYTYLISQLKEKYPNLSYLHLIQSRALDNPAESNEPLFDIWSPRPLIVADGFTRDAALSFAERDGFLIAFGKHFISNPDLPGRLEAVLPLSDYDQSTFYGGDDSGKGYTDYAFAPRN
ncbi:FMN-linked oxidoreductase [Rhodocollybia butyracea]|uniref:FMN-linked oxidoreductase n=1 Tax=Rhodocollybia butyracea TaxID=206335 RepID=A0A9P5QBS7_9AGAR|nr:FMN-linked oxidoreductase [Rhodocollybia butyracea]